MGSSLIAVSVRTGLNCRTPSWRCREFLGVGENPHVWRQKCRECDSGGGIKETHWRSVDFSLHKTKRKVAQVEKSRCASTSTKREQRPLHPLAHSVSFFSLIRSFWTLASMPFRTNAAPPISAHTSPHQLYLHMRDSWSSSSLRKQPRAHLMHHPRTGRQSQLSPACGPGFLSSSLSYYSKLSPPALPFPLLLPLHENDGEEWGEHISRKRLGEIESTNGLYQEQKQNQKVPQ